MITKHFNRSEFACKCGCGFDVVDIELVKALEQLRYYIKKPVIINSGCRCKEHNTKIGGAPKSKHMHGKAADIVVKDTKASVVQEFFKDHNGGLGSYSTFTHIDVSDKRRWSE